MAKFSYNNLTDSELVSRCVNRDPLAWNQFVERFSKLVFWAIKERLSSRGCYCSQEDLGDIFQNIFANLWIKNLLKQVRAQEKIKTWLIMVSGNMAIDYVRKNNMQTIKEETSIYQSISERLPDEEEITLEAVLASDSGDPRAGASANEIVKLLEQEMEKLNPKEKTVLELDVLYDMKQKDIADVVKLPINTVSSIIVRGKEKLRESLKEKVDFLRHI